MVMVNYTRKMDQHTLQRRVHFVIIPARYGQMSPLLTVSYTHRYGKVHSCENTLVEATKIMPSAEYPYKPSSFVFAGPDQFKYDKTIDIFTAYKRYIASKPWAATNYLRDPSRKPDWL